METNRQHTPTEDYNISFIEDNIYLEDEYLEDEDLEHSYDIRDIQEEDLDYVEELTFKKIPHDEPILKRVTDIDLENLFGKSTELAKCIDRNPTPGKQIQQLITYPIDYYISNGAFTD